MSFDLGAYTRTAHGSHRDAVGDVGGLSADDLRLVALLRDLEAGTMGYLRRVLVTPTHKDARVTAFLVTWSYERFWVADALGAVLAANGGTDTPAEGAGTIPVRGHARARRGPVRRALGAFFSGSPLVAAHLASLAVDAAVLLGAHRALAARVAPPDAVTLFTRLAEVQARQSAFLTDEASVRLSASRRAVRLARRELRDEAYPLGLADRSVQDRAAFSRLAFGDASGSRAIEAAIEPVIALPGLADAVGRLRGHLTAASSPVTHRAA